MACLQYGCCSRAVLKGPDFFFCQGPPLRTAPRDHQPPTTNPHQPPTATNRRQSPAATNRQLPTTANRHQPPITNHQAPPTTTNHHQPPVANCQPPTAANRQPPPTPNHQPPTATNRQLPTANRQPPPTANRHQPPPTMVEHMECPRAFWENWFRNTFFFPLRTALCCSRPTQKASWGVTVRTGAGIPSHALDLVPSLQPRPLLMAVSLPVGLGDLGGFGTHTRGAPPPPSPFSLPL